MSLFTCMCVCAHVLVLIFSLPREAHPCNPVSLFVIVRKVCRCGHIVSLQSIFCSNKIKNNIKIKCTLKFMINIKRTTKKLRFRFLSHNI